MGYWFCNVAKYVLLSKCLWILGYRLGTNAIKTLKHQISKISEAANIVEFNSYPSIA